MIKRDTHSIVSYTQNLFVVVKITLNTLKNPHPLVKRRYKSICS
jgi:hypothetical protein